MRNKAAVLLAVGVIVGCDMSGNPSDSGYQSPKQALEAFYANPGPEDTLMDPLIVQGPSVYPLVIEAVADPKMPLRRYAIGFLGNEEVADALPVLVSILKADSELPYFRGDALEAIYQIDKEHGKTLAVPYRGRDDTLGRSALDVLEDAEYLQKRRSLEKARRRWHD